MEEESNDKREAGELIQPFTDVDKEGFVLLEEEKAHEAALEGRDADSQDSGGKGGLKVVKMPSEVK